MKKILAVLLLVALFTGCSSQKESNETSNQQTQENKLEKSKSDDTYNQAVAIVNGEKDGIVILSVST